MNTSAHQCMLRKASTQTMFVNVIGNSEDMERDTEGKAYGTSVIWLQLL